MADSIGLYRKATGAAPLPPRAVFGFMHSKDRFKDQATLTAAAKGFRDGSFPIDTIVQDWFFWPSIQNSFVNHGFDPKRYPDPAAMTKQLHEWNMHFMVTYWPVRAFRLYLTGLEVTTATAFGFLSFSHAVAYRYGSPLAMTERRWPVKTRAW